MFGLNREGKSWADQVGLPESDPADTSCQTVGYKAAPVSGYKQSGRSFVRLHHGRSGLSTATTCGFNRLLDFSGFRIRAANRLHTGRRIRVTGYLLWGDEHNEAQR